MSNSTVTVDTNWLLAGAAMIPLKNHLYKNALKFQIIEIKKCGVSGAFFQNVRSLGVRYYRDICLSITYEQADGLSYEAVRHIVR